ncbi:MAG: serine hydrolase [Saprospiraceae bacterium]|nr:serine hydrolase [Saprospiraceae bacterium]
MKSHLHFLAAVLLFFSVQSRVFSQDNASAIEDLLAQYHELGKFNGSALIAFDGKVVYKGGAGDANMEWDIPNNENTKHRLGSITKQFTAMLILQLAQEGKLDLQAPINTYLADYPEKTGSIVNTHHLLTHTSGIPNYTAFPDFFSEKSRDPSTPKDFIDNFSEMDLEFEPGSKFSYSNSGYFLLGVLLEESTGKSYENLLHERILDPLNMHDSGYNNHEDILSNRAAGYEKRGRSYINAPYLDMSLPYAAGSMYSSANDLYKWDRALYSNNLLSEEYMEMYFKPYIPAFGDASYAYGWGVGKEAIGNSTDSLYIIQHGGGINGFNTLISRSPTDESLVVLLNNTGGAPLGEMGHSIRAILYGKSYNKPKASLAYDVLDKVYSDGLDEGLAYYKANKDSESFEVSEGEFNDIGYELLATEKLNDAAAIFKLNMEAFPKSFNVYDSYAEAKMKQGEDEEAIKYYKKSVEMNPGNQNGIDKLKKLGVSEEDIVQDAVLTEEQLDKHIGQYELMPDFVITITREGTQLKAQATGQPVFDIFPKSENEFYLKVVPAQLKFNSNEEGETVSVTLLQGGRETTGNKL